MFEWALTCCWTPRLRKQCRCHKKILRFDNSRIPRSKDNEKNLEFLEISKDKEQKKDAKKVQQKNLAKKKQNVFCLKN